MNLQPRKKILAVFGAAAILTVAAAVYSFIPLSVPDIDNSPDEMSNRYFAGLYAETGELWSYEPLNGIADDVIHPRSVSVVEGLLVPGGFIGLPVIYGLLARLFGGSSVVFFTPLFAVIGILAWGGLTSRFFGRRFGVFSAALLMIQPAWWYSASRTLQPNVLFASLLICAAYVYFAAPFFTLSRRFGGKGEPSRLGRLKLVDAAVSGILLAFALAVRMSEAYWIVLVLAVLAAYFRKRVSWHRVVVFAAAVMFAMSPFMVWNAALYGGIFSTGYGSGVLEVIEGAATGGLGARMLGDLQPYIFPLGFAPRLAMSNFFEYGISFFWWWTALVAAGLFLLACEWKKRGAGGITCAAFGWLFTAVIMACWLILFYGSWVVRDNPDPSAVTIGSSYIRYWLPLAVFSTLPVAFLMGRLADRFRRSGAIIAGFALVVVVAVSGSVVFGAAEEGLLAIRGNLERFSMERSAVLSHTEDSAVIVVDRADKVIFPHRRVVYPLRSEQTYAALDTLKRFVPLYYFGITLPDKDVRWLNEYRLPPLGLSIETVESYADQTLYRLAPLPIQADEGPD